MSDFYKYCSNLFLLFKIQIETDSECARAKVVVRDHCKQIEIRSMLAETRVHCASDKRKAATE